ncbi:MAG: virulence factor [Gammaproteobacteria bacterium]|nr:virulence factor [Gammaproteobacteria bacterium]
MEKIVVSWRDIPSQVIVKNGRKRAKVLLSHRFQQAVDRAAMRARKHSEDAYMSEWVRDRSGLEPGFAGQTSLQGMADAIAQELESAYSDERLLALIRNHGLTERCTSPRTEQ